MQIFHPVKINLPCSSSYFFFALHHNRITCITFRIKSFTGVTHLGERKTKKTHRETEGGAKVAGILMAPSCQTWSCASSTQRSLIKSPSPCDWQHQSAFAYGGEFSQLSDFSTIKVGTNMKMHAVVISPPFHFLAEISPLLFPTVNNTGAPPFASYVCVHYFCNPQETQRRRQRIKRREEELRGVK